MNKDLIFYLGIVGCLIFIGLSHGHSSIENSAISSLVISMLISFPLGIIFMAILYFATRLGMPFDMRISGDFKYAVDFFVFGIFLILAWYQWFYLVRKREKLVNLRRYIMPVVFLISLVPVGFILYSYIAR